MNTKKIISALLLLAGNAGFIGTQAMAATVPHNLFLYQFEETRLLDVDASKALMKQFLAEESSDNLTPSLDKIVRYVSPKDPNTTFEHNLVTGDIRFHRNFGRYLGDFKPQLPSTEEALKAAQIFLEENKLIPANPAELKVAHIGGLRATTLIRGKISGPIIDKLITLTYSREIGGVPTIGPGSKMILDIGEKAEVLSLTRHWRELSPKAQEIGGTEIFSLDEAQQLAKRQIAKEFGGRAKPEFLSSQITYFDNNGKFLQPVYAFETKVFLPDLKTEPLNYVSVIPVLRVSPEPLNLTKIDPKSLRAITNGDIVGGSGKRPD